MSKCCPKNNKYKGKTIICIFIWLLFASIRIFSSPLEGIKLQSFSELIYNTETLNQKGLYEEAQKLFIEFEKNKLRSLSYEEKSRFYFYMGSIVWILGNPSKALDCFSKTMAYAKSSKDIESKALCENIIDIINLYLSGKELRSKGERKASNEAFQKAIEISRLIRKNEYEMKCLRQMSINHLENDDLTEFLQCNDKSLEMARKIHYFKDEGYCLNNIGLYYFKINEYSKALINYEESLEIAKRSRNLKAESESSTNIGIVYKTIGDYDKALICFLKALEIDKSLGDKEYISIDLSNLGTVYRNKWLETNSKRDLSEAFSILNECYSILRSGNQDAINARIANNLGTISIDLNECLNSIGYYRQGLDLAKRINDKEAVSIITKNIGSALACIGNDDEALNYFIKAIDLALEIDAGHILWEAYLESADLQKRKGRYEEALKSYQDAIDTIEKSRSTINDEDLKTSFLRSNRRLEVYHNAIDLLFLMNQREPAERLIDLAFQYMERAKARGFLDSLEIGRVYAASKIDPQAEARAGEILARLSRLFRNLFNESTPPERRAAVEREIQVAEDEYERLRRDVRSHDPVYSSLRFPEILSIRDLRKKIINPDTIVFTYAIGKEAACGLALSREKETLFRLPSTGTLRDLVSGHLKSISDREHPVAGSGKDLYQVLLAPGLDRPYRRMIIVPDDILHYLPFETLGPDGVPSWTGTKADVSYAPSLSSLAEITKRADRREPGEMDLLAVAASGGGETEARPALAFTEKEVDDISRLYPPGKSLVLKGKDATEKMLKTVRFEDYRVVHFAAHGLIDEQKPVRSAIVLSADPDSAEDGLFQAREIFDLRLNADLVVLSACRSAAGRLVRGEGLEGLNRSFLFAGSSAVLMSLWPVDDEATGHLMRRFYFHLRERNSVAAALRLAKTDMIASADFTHSYYWGGFVVSGSADRRLYSKTLCGPFAAAGAVVVLVGCFWFWTKRGEIRRNQPDRRRIF